MLQRQAGGIMKCVIAALIMALAPIASLAGTNPAAEHRAKGESLLSSGDVDAAIQEFREAVNLEPKNSQNHFELGVALRRRGQLDDAISEYRQAIRLEPGLAEAHANIGTILQSQGDYAQAISEYRQAIRLQPKLAV